MGFLFSDSSFGSNNSRREVHSPQQVSEARIRAEAVEPGVYAEESHLLVLPLEAFFQPFKGLVFFAKPGINQGQVERRDILSFGSVLQFVENLLRFGSSACRRINVSERPQDVRSVLQLSRFFKFSDGVGERLFLFVSHPQQGMSRRKFRVQRNYLLQLSDGPVVLARGRRSVDER